MITNKIPEHWRSATIGDITRGKLNNGIFRKNPDYLTDGSAGLPVVWLQELFIGNSIDTKNSRRVIATKSEIEKYGLKYGDILFCRSSLKLDGIAFNNVFLGEDNAALFECHLIRLSPRLEEVSPVFLNWLLRSPQSRAIAKSMAKTATMTTIDQSGIASIPLVLPPLAEQKRIAAILDAADALRAKRREALAQLDALLQSSFLTLFGDPVSNPMGWPVIPFVNAGQTRLGKMLDKGKQSGAHLRPYLANTNVKWGRFELQDLRQMDFNPADRKEFALLPGDLLICEGGEVGRCAIWKGELEECYFQKAIHRCRVDRDKAVPEFLQYFLWFMALRGGFKDFVTTSTIAHLTGEKLRKLPVILPPLPLQQKFAAIVESIERQKEKQRAHLAELDSLFAALQHRAFRGEL